MKKGFFCKNVKWMVSVALGLALCAIPVHGTVGAAIGQMTVKAAEAPATKVYVGDRISAGNVISIEDLAPIEDIMSGKVNIAELEYKYLQDCEYTVSDPAIASVDSMSQITFLAEGVVTVTVTGGDGKIHKSKYQVLSQQPDIPINKKNFPGLYQVLKSSSYDKNEDGVLSQSEQGKITEISTDKKVSSLEGIAHFPNLKSLFLTNYTGTKMTVTQANQSLTEITADPKGKSLTVDAPYVKRITLGPCYIGTSSFFVGTEGGKGSNNGDTSNKVKSLDLSKCSRAEGLKIFQSSLTRLTLPSEGKALKYLDLEYYKGTKLPSLKKYTNMAFLGIRCCSKITGIDISKNTKLKAVVLVMNRKLAKLDCSKNKKLKVLYTYQNHASLASHITLPKGVKVSRPGTVTSASDIGNKVWYAIIGN